MVTVLTSITNNYDRLSDDFVKGGAEWLAFLDDETEKNFISSKIWDVRPMRNIHTDPNRNAKIYKLLSHRFTDSEYTIWIDANITLKISPEKLVNKWLNSTYDLAVFKHPFRNCVYKEGREVIACGKDNPDVVLNHLDKYRSEGWLADNGLAECAVLVTRRTKEINTLFERWWCEVSVGSRRDQISFPYVFQGKYRLIEGNVRNHEDFEYRKHHGY